MSREDLAEHLGWLYEARLGMFIHWGLYSVAARHEWVKNREHVPDEDYDLYFEHFDPDLYDPRGLGPGGQQRGYAVLRGHDQASRGVLPVGLAVHRLQGHQDPGEERLAGAHGRRLPR